MSLPRRLFGITMAAAAPLWLMAGLASGAGIIRHDRTGGRSERRPQRYYVLQVMGVSGQVTFEVASDLELKNKLKDYEEELAKARQEWMKAKIEASKRKEEFKDPAPKGPRLMQKLEPTFKKEEDARARAEQLQKQWDDAVAKKEAAKEGTAKKEEAKQE